LRVAQVVPEGTTVTSVYLAATDGAPLPAARAGQYLTLRITGAGPPAPVRSYSLSLAPGTGTYRISVKHDPTAPPAPTRTPPAAGAILDTAAPRGEFVSTTARPRCC
jgi:ferredoxin-NADP reductase